MTQFASVSTSRLGTGDRALTGGNPARLSSRSAPTDFPDDEPVGIDVIVTTWPNVPIVVDVIIPYINGSMT